MWNTIPNSIKELHKLFSANNKSLFVVGGSVRDFLNNEEPKDFDIATDATPDEVLDILKGYRTNQQGKAFGVVVVYTEDGNFEIATFREDVYGEKLGETRNPDVKFTTIDKDVLRRDLTFNALFYDLDKQEIVDLVGGVEDIKNKVTKFVGDPNLRIEEDPLRILRLLRFASRYQFNIDKESADAIYNNIHKLSIITKERIWEEIKKAFSQSKDFTSYMELLMKFKINYEIFPDLLLNNEAKKFKFLETYFAYLFMFISTYGLLDIMKFNFKMEHDFSRTVVFLIDLLKLRPEAIQHFFKQSSGISREIIDEWYAVHNLKDSKKHKAFLNYKPTVSAIELMEQGYQGKKLGNKITELEINNFKQLIENETE